MSAPLADHDVLSPSPKERTMSDPSPQNHSIPLTTSVKGNVITISGNGDWTLRAGAPAMEFQFTLADTSGANVQFASLDTADNISTCPPTGSGNQSGQVTGITMNNNSPTKNARFNDNNNNPAVNGPMNVSYQWNFTCDSTHTVQPFDPIISNGGKVSS